MSTREERFAALFSGLPRAYGRFDPAPGGSPGEKVKGRAITVTGEVEVGLWAKHLGGEQGLGIVPIRDNGTCLFAAIDIDVYNLDLPKLEQAVDALGLPLALCRTKSGGAHLYLFLLAPALASTLRPILDSWAKALGYPGVEVFPKQDRLASERDVGNWINMPYFGAEKTTRYALYHGQRIGVDDFLKYAEQTRADPSGLKAVEAPMVEGFETAPPCLQQLVLSGFPDGSMNNGLLSLGVYARKKYGDQDWEGWVERYNQDYLRGNPREVQGIIQSLRRKGYQYLCHQPPLKALCNKAQCRAQEHGIGGGPVPEVTGLVRYPTDPVTWILTVKGQRIELANVELMRAEKFREACLGRIAYLPPAVKKDQWETLVNKLLETCQEVEVPDDAGVCGQFLGHFEDFLLARAQAREKDELLRGKPWTNEHGITYFRSKDLMHYLETKRFRGYTSREAWNTLSRTNKMRHCTHSVKGVKVRTWGIADFAHAQNEPHTVPEIAPEEF